MEQPQNFRSAFNGFNREDVVRYLEYLNAKHASTYTQLTGELHALRQKLETPDDGALAQLQTRCAELENALAAEQAVKEQAIQRAAELEQQVLTLQQEKAELEQQTEDARKFQQTAQARCTELEAQANRELEAYRRAERAERVARERADRIYSHTNGLLSEATVLVDDAAKEIDTVSQEILRNMDILRTAVEKSRAAMKDASAAMFQIRPDEEEV